MVKSSLSRWADPPGNLPQAIAVWKVKVDKRLADVFRVYSKSLPLGYRPMRRAVEILTEFTLRPASKRIRAFLVKLGYEAGGQTGAEALVDAAAAIELLQVYLLIHDDIIDRELTRRGGPTVHRAIYASLTGPLRERRRLSECLAMLIGDLAFSWSVHLLTDSDWPAERRSQALRALLSSHETCVGGQYLDVLPPSSRFLARQHVAEIASRKTASYTLVGPLTVGAVLAGAPRQTIAALQGYGRSAGLAFQWIDDLNDVTEAIHNGKLSSDIQECKISAVVIAARSHLKPSQRRRLDSLMLKADGRRATAWERQRLIQSTAFKSIVLKEARGFVNRGTAALRKSATLNQEAIDKLSDLGQYILNLTSE